MFKVVPDIEALSYPSQGQPKDKPYQIIPDTVNLFVYGTLKPGFSNHRIVEPYALQCIPASFQGGILYDLGVGFPAIVLDRRSKSIVKGHIITLAQDSPGLAQVDRLEGHYGPKAKYNHYQKSQIYNVISWDGQTAIRAWVYHYTKAQAARCGQPLGRSEWIRADYLDRGKAGRISKSVADRFLVHRKEQEKNWGNL